MEYQVSLPYESTVFNGLTHDGSHLYRGAFIARYEFYTVDDGTDQIGWMSLDRLAGALRPEFDQDLFLSFDAAGRVEGYYQADLHLITNDPVNLDVAIPVTLIVGDGGAAPECQPGALPSELLLQSGYPNPFNGETLLRYALPQPGVARLDMFDCRGRLLQSLITPPQAAGWHSWRVSSAGLPSGVYWARLAGGDATRATKIAVVR